MSSQQIGASTGTLATLPSNSLATLSLVMTLSFSFYLAPTQVSSQQQRSDRESFGDVRANIMESLLRSVLPGSHLKWAPMLLVEDASRHFVSAQFPGLTLAVSPDGSMHGASGLELTNDKAQAIFDSAQFRSIPSRKLPTTIVVFQADANGIVTHSRKLDLDPSDPLAEIKLLQISTWPNKGWPVLQVRYVSHIAQLNSHTRIEWQSSFDANAGSLIARLPLGMVIKERGGHDRMRMFSIRRVSPTQLDITDTLAKENRQYACDDPCIVDSTRLLAEWPVQ